MSVIRTYPDPILLQVASPVTEITDAIRELASDMVFIMRTNDAVGLAAPQIGESVRMVVIEGPLEEWKGKPDQCVVAINPEIIWKSVRTVVGKESCLSRPGFEAEVRRYKEIVVRATDLDGKQFETSATGFHARVWQHEIDHLNGIVIGAGS